MPSRVHSVNADLRDQLRLHPVGARLPDRSPNGETETRSSSRRVAQREERTAVEAGADLARVPQPFALVVAEQQCAEPGSAAARFGEAGDDELLRPGRI